jgi:hypothetical protein
MPDDDAARRYPPDDCDHGRTHCSDCDLPFVEHRYPDDPPGDDVPLTDTRCMDAMIREGYRLQAVIDAQAARLADLEAALATAQLRIGELFDLRAAAERERDALATEHAHLKDVMRFGLGDPMCGIVSHSGPCGEPLACGWPPHGTERAHSWATLPTFTEANDAD